MIDHLGFTRRRRDFSQFLFIANGIDEGRLTHITPANKGIFRLFRLWAFFYRWAADQVGCFDDFHSGKDKRTVTEASKAVRATYSLIIMGHNGNHELYRLASVIHQSTKLFFTAKNTRPAVFLLPKRSISLSLMASTVLGLISIF